MPSSASSFVPSSSHFAHDSFALVFEEPMCFAKILSETTPHTVLVHPLHACADQLLLCSEGHIRFVPREKLRLVEVSPTVWCSVVESWSFSLPFLLSSDIDTVCGTRYFPRQSDFTKGKEGPGPLQQEYFRPSGRNFHSRGRRRCVGGLLDPGAVRQCA